MRDSLVSVEAAAASEELVEGKGESLFGPCGVNPFATSISIADGIHRLKYYTVISSAEQDLADCTRGFARP